MCYCASVNNKENEMDKPKKVIDADALIKELQSIKGNLNFCNDAGRYWLDIAIETIDELATPKKDGDL